MEQTLPRFIPVHNSTYIISASSYVDKCIAGNIFCPRIGRSLRFCGLMQMFILLEQQMDEANFPQRGMEPRAFWSDSAAQKFPTAEPDRNEPRIATFNLNVLFRQNSTWQGNVIWNDKNLGSHFRSALELAELLDSALTSVISE